MCFAEFLNEFLNVILILFLLCFLLSNSSEVHTARAKSLYNRVQKGFGKRLLANLL